MLWVPQKGRVRTITNIQNVGTSGMPGTNIPSNGTTLLDGAVTEIISAANNNQDSWGICVWLGDSGAAATASEACCDILIGGATDDVLINALICGSAIHAGVSGGSGHTYFFPVHIPQGKRIAARFASVRTSINARCAITLYGGGVPPYRVGRKVTTYGTQVNNARGVAITPATSGGAATVTQIVASTTEDHFAFLPGFQVSTDTTVTASDIAIGIGVGAATEDRIGTWHYAISSNESMSGPSPWPLPAFTDVPSGTRLTMLASNVLATNDAAYDGLIYAVS